MKQAIFANVNHALIRSWNQPVLQWGFSFLLEETKGDFVQARTEDWQASTD